DGGYGCATANGTVTCTADKTCTGTCSNCGQAPSAGRPGVTHPAPVLGNARAPAAKATPGNGHPVIAGGMRAPVTGVSRLPPSAGTIALYAGGGHGKR